MNFLSQPDMNINVNLGILDTTVTDFDSFDALIFGTTGSFDDGNEQDSSLLDTVNGATGHLHRVRLVEADLGVTGNNTSSDVVPRDFRHEGPQVDDRLCLTLQRNTLSSPPTTQNSKKRSIESAGLRLASSKRIRPTTQAKPRSFHCPSCPSSYADNRSLLRHQREKHQQLSRVWRCAEHEVSFGRKEYYDRHMRYQHNSTDVECMVCGKEVSQRYIEGHWRSKTCQAYQARSDSQAVAAMAASHCNNQVDISGRFGAQSAANALFVCAKLEEQVSKGFMGGKVPRLGWWSLDPSISSRGREQPPLNDRIEFNNLWGLALRLFKKSLIPCPSSARREVVATLQLLCGLTPPISGKPDGILMELFENLAMYWCFPNGVVTVTHQGIYWLQSRDPSDMLARARPISRRRTMDLPMLSRSMFFPGVVATGKVGKAIYTF